MPTEVYLYVPTTDEERFWKRTDRENGPTPDEIVYPGLGRCWIMSGSTSRSAGGYRNFTLGRKQRYAHVAAYILDTGHEPPVEAPNVTHLCDNGHLGCVRPSHLKADTQAGNTLGKAMRQLRARIIRQAYADHAQWPQYADHWTGAEWRLVRFSHRIETTLGVAFEPDDYTVARAPFFVGNGWTAYSFRNKINTGVLGGFRVVEY